METPVRTADKAKPWPAPGCPGIVVAKNLQTVARRALTPCGAADSFRFADGTSARDLSELRHAVATKSAYLVAHHREHYHAWIERVLGDPALARRIERLARRRVSVDDYRVDLSALLDERVGKLRDRVA